MVFGLVNFLLGGKKKPVSKAGAVSTPMTAQNTGAGTQPAAGAQPDGVNNATQNAQSAQTGSAGADTGQSNVQAGVQFVDSKSGEKVASGAGASNSQSQNGAVGSSGSHSNHSGGKKSISEVIHKLHDEVAETKERVTQLVTDFKTVENSVTEMGHKVETLEESKKVMDEKFAEVDEQMTKFLSLYELINNQYNPFIDKESVQQVAKPAMAVTADGSVEHTQTNALGSESDGPFSKPSEPKALAKTVNVSADVDSTFLALDTLDIEEAAGDAVPLTKLKNNTNSLVVILSWLEYLINRVGIEETRNSLRYYTEVLRWVTPEVFFDLDKYLRGMKDKKVDEGASLGVKDHIVSLYFISKLNEKKLDDKLTEAVLQIIKE